MYINRHEVSGNATADAETKTTQSGDTLTKFSLATNNRWKDADTGEIKERTEFHDCIAWGKLAEIAQHIQKGDRVYVDGPVETSKWTGEDGVERRRREIKVSNLIIHGQIKKRLGAEGPTASVAEPCPSTADGKHVYDARGLAECVKCGAT